MKAVSLFRQMVASYATTCPAPLIDQSVLQACSEFCRATHAVQEVSAQTLVAGQVDYDVDVPVGMLLTTVMAVWSNNRPLELVGTDEVRLGLAHVGDIGANLATRGDPTCVFQKVPSGSVLSVYPIPTTTYTNGLLVRAAFEPLGSATQVDDILFDRYGDDIAYGAVARILELPDQPFSNPNAAQRFRRLFDASMDQARAVARTGQVRRTLRLQHRPFA